MSFCLFVRSGQKNERSGTGGMGRGCGGTAVKWAVDGVEEGSRVSWEESWSCVGVEIQ